MLGHMANLPTNGVNGHLPGDALAAGRLPGKSSSEPLVLLCSQYLLLLSVPMNTPDIPIQNAYKGQHNFRVK